MFKLKVKRVLCGKSFEQQLADGTSKAGVSLRSCSALDFNDNFITMGQNNALLHNNKKKNNCNYKNNNKMNNRWSDSFDDVIEDVVVQRNRHNSRLLLQTLREQQQMRIDNTSTTKSSPCIVCT